MTDEELGRKIEDAVWPDDGIRWPIHIRAKVGAAARAALTGPEVTREDVEKWYHQIQGDLQHEPIRVILAALRHFARAPGGKVPSAEALHIRMQEASDKRNGLLVPFVAAEVAHAMMQKIGGGQRMMIEGMTIKDLDGALKSVITTNSITEWALEKIVMEVIRLATTPDPVEDPDRKAKRLCWEFYCVICPDPMKRGYDNADHLWTIKTEPERNGWRAVAKETGSE